MKSLIDSDDIHYQQAKYNIGKVTMRGENRSLTSYQEIILSEQGAKFTVEGSGEYGVRNVLLRAIITSDVAFHRSASN